MSDYYNNEIEKYAVPVAHKETAKYQAENLLTVVTEKMSDDDVRNLIATMKVNNMSNLMGIQGEKALNGAKSVINLVGGIFGHGHTFTKKHVKNEKEQYQECIQELQSKSRDSLNNIFRRMLTERVAANHCVLLDDELSSLVVDKAANYLNINENLTPSEKIDVVFKAYFERISKKMQERIRSFTPVQREKLARSIQKEYDKLSEEKKQKMMKASNLNSDDWKEIMYALKAGKFSGEELRSMMGTTGLAGLAWGAGSSFAFYTMVPVVMHGFFTTLLGITLPFAAYTGAVSAASIITGPIGFLALAGYGIWKYSSSSKKVDGEVYCQMIFAACAALGRSFAPNEDDLPKWVVQRTPMQLRNDEEFTLLRQKSQNAEARTKNAARRAAEAAREVNQLHRELVERKRYAHPNTINMGISSIEHALKSAQAKEQQAIQQKAIADNEYFYSLQREYPKQQQRYEKLVHDLTEWGNDSAAGVKIRFSRNFIIQLSSYAIDVQKNIIKSITELRSHPKASNDTFIISHTPWMIIYNYDNSFNLLTIEKTTDKESFNYARTIRQLKRDGKLKDEQLQNADKKIHRLNNDNVRLKSEKPVMYYKEEIRQQFNLLIDTAEYELDIISPWINYFGVINRTVECKNVRTGSTEIRNMANDFEKLLKKGVMIKIIYGWEDDEKSRNSVSAMIKRFGHYQNFRMKRAKESGGDHSKVVLCDEKLYLFGSANVLSFGAIYTNKNGYDIMVRKEMMEKGSDPDYIRKLREENFSWF